MELGSRQDLRRSPRRLRPDQQRRDAFEQECKAAVPDLLQLAARRIDTVGRTVLQSIQGGIEGLELRPPVADRP